MTSHTHSELKPSVWIPFNKPFLCGRELEYIEDAHRGGQLAGDGKYTRLCSEWLQKSTGSHKVLLTHSCTGALELAALLADIQPGDEIIMPSYTFVSTANAFVSRGGIPVFVDIRSDTLNLDERKIESAITPKTRAIVPVHYAGVACEMDLIMEIARVHNLIVIEDAAQGVMASYKGRALGSIGHLGAYSFHETKNIISGEGGALLVNDPNLIARAEVLREKGTNRSNFFRGAVDKYTWIDLGSSYLPGELIAAFLWDQLQHSELLTSKRLAIWNSYHTFLANNKVNANARKPFVPKGCIHNAHIYYLILQDLQCRTNFIEAMANNGINCVFHYVPLHSSPAGRKFGRASGSMNVTESIADGLVRLPMWIGLDEHVEFICETVIKKLSC